jgi:hypothetical protein
MGSDIDTVQPVKGAVVTEVVENTSIFFGNTATGAFKGCRISLLIP